MIGQEGREQPSHVTARTPSQIETVEGKSSCLPMHLPTIITVSYQQNVQTTTVSTNDRLPAITYRQTRTTNYLLIITYQQNVQTTTVPTNDSLPTIPYRQTRTTNYSTARTHKYVPASVIVAITLLDRPALPVSVPFKFTSTL